MGQSISDLVSVASGALALYLLILCYHVGSGALYKARTWTLYKKRALSNEQRVHRESGIRIR